VDDDRAEHTVSVLDRVVGMIPGGPVLSSLPLVGVAVVGRDGAFSLRGGTVGIVCVELSEAVEVDAGAVERQLVAHSDLHIVTPVGFDFGAGILAIDRHHALLDAIWGQNCFADFEVELSTCQQRIRHHKI